MLVRGMSFQKGIIFMGKNNIACTYHNNGKEISWMKPLKVKTLVEISILVFLSMPLWFHGLLAVWLGFIIFPPLLTWLVEGVSLKGLPEFTLLFFLFGTHFWFPRELKKYHGAEHKVFSYKGIISFVNRESIAKAKITNRHCSTNGVLLYFLTVIFLTIKILLLTQFAWISALEIAAYSSLLLSPIVTYCLNRTKETFFHRWILQANYWLQKYITTSEPERKHINTAIRSYRQLALKEFPSKARIIQKKKERESMAIADITIIPIGTSSTSVSNVVAEIHRILRESNKEITYELTPMSTLVEGELSTLLEVIREIHEVPFKLGHKRVATNIRIDDRRDRLSTMAGKLNSVNSQLSENAPK